MLNIEPLLRLTRVNEYLKGLFLVFPLIFLVSPQNLFTSTSVIIFLAIFFLTAFSYTFNDIEDAEDDYHDTGKRLRNTITSKELTRNQGTSFSLFLLFTGLILHYIVSPLVFILGLSSAVIGFLYSWKPVRLKAIPIIDLISHVLFLGAIQFFMIYLAFRKLDLLVIPYLMIIIPYSLIIQISGELIDFKVDKKTKITNTIQKFSELNVKKALFILSLLVFAGFSSLIFTMPLENRIINQQLFLY